MKDRKKDKPNDEQLYQVSGGRYGESVPNIPACPGCGLRSNDDGVCENEMCSFSPYNVPFGP